MKVKIDKENERILRDFFSLKIPTSIYLKNDLIDLDYDISCIVNSILNDNEFMLEKNQLLTESKIKDFNDLINSSNDSEKNEIKSYFNCLSQIVKVIDTYF